MQPNKPFYITYNALLALYLVAPLGLCIALIDTLFFHHGLQKILPVNPETVRFLTIFLVMPHIICSASTFFDMEYLKYYKNKLLCSIPIIIFLSILVPLLFGIPAAAIVYSLFTVTHIVSQQAGVSALMLGERNIFLSCWKWLFVLSVSMIYLIVFKITAFFPTQLTSAIALNWMVAIIIFSGIGMLVLGHIVCLKSKSMMGKRYIWANNFMLLCSCACIAMGYTFFGILISRIIHDLTAFIFYLNHDANRNADKNNNFLLGYFNFLKIPVIFFSPLFAILIANLLLQVRGTYLWIQVSILLISYFHYYTERFMWRGDNLHRKAIRIRT
jgi:hypothetical protein